MSDGDVLQQGDIIGGKYRIHRTIGQGGMGTVYSAHHGLLDHPVAIKVCRAPSGSPKAKARFLREARTVAKIDSDHTARVFDMGTLDSGEPYIVMELLKGSDLATLLERNGSFAEIEAIQCILQAIEALAHAHALGVIHRDLKPANLFFSQAPGRAPIIKVLDFGISKLELGVAEPYEPLTSNECVIGTPSYMSPEQLRSSRDLDVRSDVWSLGVILYELLSGRRPFEGQSLGECIANILEARPVPLRTHRPDVREEVAAIVDRCLQRRPQDRYANVAELAAALASTLPDPQESRLERIREVLGQGPRGPLAEPSYPSLDAVGSLAYATTGDQPTRTSTGSRLGGSTTSSTGGGWGKRRPPPSHPRERTVGLQVAGWVAALLAVGTLALQPWGRPRPESLTTAQASPPAAAPTKAQGALETRPPAAPLATPDSAPLPGANDASLAPKAPPQEPPSPTSSSGMAPKPAHRRATVPSRRNEGEARAEAPMETTPEVSRLPPTDGGTGREVGAFDPTRDELDLRNRH